MTTLEPNRIAITGCVILATVMQALDTTIANVALPYMQGSVSATQEQINWVLTSYILAAAIMTLPTGFLSNRFGRKHVLLVSVAGFTFASVLCGMAQSLTQIVLFRVLQGMFGAALVPLSQSIMFTIYPKERQGSAMAIWGIAVMVGPILGPILGGWLTENYSWRWVFYINVPIGMIALLGISTFLHELEKATAKLDWLGFGTLSLAIGAMQVLLDRGQELDWFSSREIWTEALISLGAFYLFLVDTFTSDEPFINPALFRDRNFTAGTIFISIVGVTYYASMSLMAPFLQELMNYPVVIAGLVMGPRGIGTMASMFLVGRLVGKTDTRLLLAFGLGMTAWSLWQMTSWTQDVSIATILTNGIIQGIGQGFLFVPLSTTALSTLAPRQLAMGASLFSLSRNVGSSVGISMVNALLVRNTQINHAEIVVHVTATNRMFEDPAISQSWNPFTAHGRAALDALITQQAQLIAYIDDYKLMMFAVIGVLPLLLLLRGKPARS